MLARAFAERLRIGGELFPEPIEIPQWKLDVGRISIDHATLRSYWRRHRFALDWARDRGYAGMQFNAVVETDHSAVQKRLGFNIIEHGTGYLEHPMHGRLSLHIMYRAL